MSSITADIPTNTNNSGALLQNPDLLNSLVSIQLILDALPCYSFIVNENKNIILTNKPSNQLFDINTLEASISLGIGDSIKCIHAVNVNLPCSHSDACHYCDILRAISDCQHNKEKIDRECHLTTVSGDHTSSWDFNVHVSPIQINYATFYLVTMVDISHEKRRQNLERIFFHDLINIAGGLKGIIDFLKDNPTHVSSVDLLKDIDHLSETLLEEIAAQKDLSAAENDDLDIEVEPMNSMDVISRVIKSMHYHASAKGKQIITSADSQHISVICDPRLLKRIVTNMLKNALEATNNGQIVTIGCRESDKKVEIWVNNPGLISEEAKYKIFQRSFSTKGNGRGLGTYSMKLLTEKYLNGKITFESSENNGTTFKLFLPIMNYDK